MGFAKTADFDYRLPDSLIAQTPCKQRDNSRLLHLSRDSRTWVDRTFLELPNLLTSSDLLIVNNSRVLKARLTAKKNDRKGKIELLAFSEVEPNLWWCLVKPGKKVQQGSLLQLVTPFIPSLSNEPYSQENNLTHPTTSLWSSKIVKKNQLGHCLIRFEHPANQNVRDAFNTLGELPLPPYIQRETPSDEDADRYQTIFARAPGSIAAPTAGLHFTPALTAALRAKGVSIAELTLHVGLGTFMPVKTEIVQDHEMHEEHFQVPRALIRQIEETKDRNGRVIAVGTTSLRALESLANHLQHLGDNQVYQGSTKLFVTPPWEFKLVDALITNFHLPKSTLLMLVSAFASPGGTGGIDLIRDAYQHAICENYRFFSYGDAMFIS